MSEAVFNIVQLAQQAADVDGDPFVVPSGPWHQGTIVTESSVQTWTVMVIASYMMSA